MGTIWKATYVYNGGHYLEGYICIQWWALIGRLHKLCIQWWALFGRLHNMYTMVGTIWKATYVYNGGHYLEGYICIQWWALFGRLHKLCIQWWALFGRLHNMYTMVGTIWKATYVYNGGHYLEGLECLN